MLYATGRTASRIRHPTHISLILREKQTVWQGTPAWEGLNLLRLADVKDRDREQHFVMPDENLNGGDL
jgi:hypothetical protein